MNVKRDVREREKERERNNEVAKLCVSVVEEQTG